MLNKYNRRILIKDFWDADLCAIGLSDSSQKFLIYISTFGLPFGRFNIVLENLKDNREISSVVGEYSNVTSVELEKLLIGHLKINEKIDNVENDSE